MDPNDPLYPFRQRYANWRLFRFAGGWGLALSILAVILGQWWALITGVIALAIVVIASMAMSGVQAQANAAMDYMMFGTPEGQQAISDEAARMLREMRERKLRGEE